MSMDYSNSMFPSEATFDGWFYTKVAFEDLPVRVSVGGDESYPRIRVEGDINGRLFCLQISVPFMGRGSRPGEMKHYAARARRQWDRTVQKNEHHVPYDFSLVREWAGRRPVKLLVNDAWGGDRVMRFCADLTLMVSPAAYHEALTYYDPFSGVYPWRPWTPAGGPSYARIGGVSFIA